MRKSSRTVGALFSAILLLTPAYALAQTRENDLKSELEHLHDQWFTAFDKGDGATMDRMEVPNLILVNADRNGGIWQKPGPRAGRQKPAGVTSRKLTNTQVRQFGDTAILTGIVRTNMGEKTENASTTVVWIRQSGKWLIASAQWSEIAGPEK